MENNKKETNMMAVLGFVFSILFSIIGLILSIIALKQIKETHEEGKGLATAGLIISAIKVSLSVLIIGFTLISIIFTEGIWGSLKDNIIDNNKCLFASECEYDETSGNYNCYYDYQGEGEYIICDEDSINANAKIDRNDKATHYSDYTYDEDFEDTHDYDREY